MKKSYRTLIVMGLVALASILIAWAFVDQKKESDTETYTPTTPEPQTIKPTASTLYYPYRLQTDTPHRELEKITSGDNVDTILKFNRIDEKFLKKGATVIIPAHGSDFSELSPFPQTLFTAQSIPKLIFISQRIQAFAVYAYGSLIRWGPVSSGKQSTPTPNNLYFTNWKGKEVHSSFSDEWIMKWDFNLDNFSGTSMHEYEMPGYPASHSCVRMFGSDAKWLYEWADEWVVSADGRKLIAHGTPVIIFGQYLFGVAPPWTLLPENEHATDITIDELNTELETYLPTIDRAALERPPVEVPTF